MRWLGLIGDAVSKPVPGIIFTALAWHAFASKCGCSIRYIGDNGPVFN
jgi:hypothetical protein